MERPDMDDRTDDRPAGQEAIELCSSCRRRPADPGPGTRHVLSYVCVYCRAELDLISAIGSWPTVRRMAMAEVILQLQQTMDPEDARQVLTFMARVVEQGH